MAPEPPALGREGEERREGEDPNAKAAVGPLVQKVPARGARQNAKGRRLKASAFLFLPSL